MQKTVTTELQGQDSNPELSLQTQRVSGPTRPRGVRGYGPTLQMSTSRHRSIGQEVGRCALRPGWSAWLLAQPAACVWTPLEQEGGPSWASAGRGRYLTCLPACLPSQQMFKRPCKVGNSRLEDSVWEQRALLIPPHPCLPTDLIATAAAR